MKKIDLLQRKILEDVLNQYGVEIVVGSVLLQYQPTGGS